MPSTWPYGTRVKPGAPDQLFMGEELIRDVLGDWAVPLSNLVRYVHLISLPTATLCASDPPTDIEFDLEDLQTLAWEFATTNTSVTIALKLSRRVLAHVWPLYCEYIPAPDPIADPVPDPEPIEPPEVPPGLELPPPPAPYDDTAIAERLDYLTTLVTRNAEMLTWVLNNVAVRTYGASPQSHTMEGASAWWHGPAVAYTIYINEPLPEYFGHEAGFNPAYYDLGDVWFGQQGKTGTRRKLERIYSFLPTEGQLSNTIQWNLRPGVTGIVWPHQVLQPLAPYDTGD